MKPLPPHPVLRAGDYVLRPLTMADAPDWYEWLSEYDVSDAISYDVRSVSDVRRIVAWYLERRSAGDAHRWMIRGADDGPVGTVGFNVWDTASDRAEIGYDLRPSHWGRGIMTAACRAVLAFAFEQGVNRAEAIVLTPNERSSRVLSRLGFRSEGILREYRRVRGAYRDAEMFSLLRREWQAEGA
ncbi:MAG TPA: GNAT family N-acetyltransferase [Dehalococcoidia bacterium]|nr:GNAT family N-acetyltransferase [Dehalococcoidia bacterium]